MPIKNILIYKSNDKRLKNNGLFNVTIDPNLSCFAKLREYLIKEGVSLSTLDVGTAKNTDLIVIHDIPYTEPMLFIKLIFSKVKKILYLYEPPIINPFNYFKIFHRFFDAVFTWDDSLVDNRRYFKFYTQQADLVEQIEEHAFSDKKFLCVINGNKLPFLPFTLLSTMGKEIYSERIRAIDYFEKNLLNLFELWGKRWNKVKKYSLKESIFGFKIYKCYRGEVHDKLDLLSKFKFCLCFENSTDLDGYISEKIFDCLKARCVPIYYGATNVENFIPSTCFIDYRKFKSLEGLISFLNSIDEETYNKYLDSIDRLLDNQNFLSNWFEDGWVRATCRQFKEVHEREKF